MAGRVNIGSFRDNIKVYYEVGQTASPMGSTIQTLESCYIHADVNQIDSRQAVYLGLNNDVRAYSVVYRTQTDIRPVKVAFRGEEMVVISTRTDKLNRFTSLIVKSER